MAVSPALHDLQEAEGLHRNIVHSCGSDGVKPESSLPPFPVKLSPLWGCLRAAPGLGRPGVSTSALIG